MIQLLFLVLFAEGVVALLLMVKIGPLRELVMKSLDHLKTGKSPATVKTIAGTMSVILISSITSILKIQNKGAKLGTVSPMDQVLWRTHLLEASLIGYSLFLGFVIDRLHHYLQKVTGLRTENQHLRKKEEKASKEIKLLGEEISNLTENLKKMKLACEDKENQVLSKEAHVAALQKQNEDLLLEYDRLLEDNQNLQSQAIGYRN
ncbi:uncharacterized protein LOC122090075 [Macadamia integrifolia]|uniref:uncharacterized protein LOC122090075 n=1 Tax=Macadamia integrifolia TaxID=60698 RepID=UPI001C4EF4E4|nr:uncharacterized protein LOC122090075 [Macadamia integrifolia]